MQNRRVLITGVSRGLGRVLGAALVQEGYLVAAIARTREALLTLKEELLKEKGELFIFPTDITKEDEVQRLLGEVEEVLGGVDILINNAAFHQSLPIGETPLKVWQETLKVNLTGSFLLIKGVIPLMKRDKGGIIINVSSTAAHTYFPGFGAYSASKGGLNSLAMVLAEEVSDDHIRVYTLDLGLVNTGYTRSRIKDGKIDEWLQPEEVVEVVKFLLSKEGAPLRGGLIKLHGQRK